MPRFVVRHSTIYTYPGLVTLGDHALYLRPRADHALNLESATLTLSPPADVIWRNDAYGNSLAIARFAASTSQLEIVSDLVVETFPRTAEQRSALMARASDAYTSTERRALAPFLEIDPRSKRDISGWLKKTVDKKKPVFDKLLECTARIRYEFDYRIRYEAGVQTPARTLETHSGTCRDFAELMITASRSLGCAARFVTGYIYTPNAAPGSLAPHAWAECYTPGAGWVEIDATNGLVEPGDLIPVAVAVAGAELSPVSGSYVGGASTLSVGVTVDKLA